MFIINLIIINAPSLRRVLFVTGRGFEFCAIISRLLVMCDVISRLLGLDNETPY